MWVTVCFLRLRGSVRIYACVNVHVCPCVCACFTERVYMQTWGNIYVKACVSV